MSFASDLEKFIRGDELAVRDDPAVQELAPQKKDDVTPTLEPQSLFNASDKVREETSRLQKQAEERAERMRLLSLNSNDTCFM